MKDLVQQFVEAINDSALAENRKQYWLHKFAKEDLSAKEELDFLTELEHLEDNLEAAIALEEAMAKGDQMELNLMNKEALPALKEASEEVDGLLSDDLNGYKRHIASLESGLFEALSKLRAESNADDIETLRKKLGLI